MVICGWRTLSSPKDSPRKVLLVDFDWGGKAAEVDFSRGTLAEELRTQGDQLDCLDRVITKGDDDQVLSGTFELPEEAASARRAETEPLGGTEIATGSTEYV